MQRTDFEDIKNGGGSGDRTHDLLFRREPLYPTELRHRTIKHILYSRFDENQVRIREYFYTSRAETIIRTSGENRPCG